MSDKINKLIVSINKKHPTTQPDLLTMEDVQESFRAAIESDRIFRIVNEPAGQSQIYPYWRKAGGPVGQEKCPCPTPEKHFRFVALQGPTPTKNYIIADLSAKVKSELDRLHDSMAEMLYKFNEHTHPTTPGPTSPWENTMAQTLTLMNGVTTPRASAPELAKILDAVRPMSRLIGWEAQTMAAVSKMVSKYESGEITRKVFQDWLPIGVDLEAVIREWKEAKERARETVAAKPKPPKIYPRCRECRNELSPELDAYYGVDTRGKDHCSPCRKELKIK